jgi:hypothetical protein
VGPERVYDGGDPAAPDKPEYYQLKTTADGYCKKVKNAQTRKEE